MVRIITGTGNQINETEAKRIRKECAKAKRGRSDAKKARDQAAAKGSLEERVKELEKALAELTKRFNSHTHRKGEGGGIYYLV